VTCDVTDSEADEPQLFHWTPDHAGTMTAQVSTRAGPSTEIPVSAARTFRRDKFGTIVLDSDSNSETEPELDAQAPEQSDTETDSDSDLDIDLVGWNPSAKVSKFVHMLGAFSDAQHTGHSICWSVTRSKHHTASRCRRDIEGRGSSLSAP